MTAADGPKRHGCLTAWLILMLVANAGTAALYAATGLKAALPDAPAAAGPLLIAIGVANVAFTIGLFLWKRWAFGGICASTVVAAAINLWLGLPVFNVLLGLAGPAVLYAVLRIGKPGEDGWSQLK